MNRRNSAESFPAEASVPFSAPNQSSKQHRLKKGNHYLAALRSSIRVGNVTFKHSRQVEC